jgi:holo-[acyl-carrier protein] synthase
MTRVPTTTGLVRQRCVLVPIPATAMLRDLLLGCPADLVFTAPERRRNARAHTLAPWAGRLAAKLAVLDLLGVRTESALAQGADLGWTSIEILPSPDGLCDAPDRCRRPHRPAVTLLAPTARLLGPHDRLAVSISHTRTMAVALAVRTDYDGHEELEAQSTVNLGGSGAE